MGIFNEFCAAITSAINDYEVAKKEKNQEISEMRKNDIKALKGILNKGADEITAVGMRVAIIKYLDSMSESIWSNIFSGLASDLKRRVLAKLEEYPKSTLNDKTYLELQENHNKLATAPDGTNLLKRNEELANEKAILKERVEVALKMNKSLESTCEQLEIRYREILQDKEKVQNELADLVKKLQDQVDKLKQLVRGLEIRVEELNKGINERDKDIIQLRKSNAELIKAKEEVLIDYDELKKEYSISLESIKNLKKILKDKGLTEEEMILIDYAPANQTVFTLNIN